MPDSDLDQVEKMLKKTRELRDEKVVQRSVLDHEIAGLEKAIEGLRTLCELPDDEPPKVGSFAQEMLKYAGLTDVVRMCLQASPVPLGATEIVAKLKDAAYPLNALENPRAAVNTILSRLLGAGEIQRKERNGDVLYSWIRKVDLGAMTRVLATPRNVVTQAPDPGSEVRGNSAPPAISRRPLKQATGERKKHAFYGDEK